MKGLLTNALSLALLISVAPVQAMNNHYAIDADAIIGQAVAAGSKAAIDGRAADAAANGEFLSKVAQCLSSTKGKIAAGVAASAGLGYWLYRSYNKPANVAARKAARHSANIKAEYATWDIISTAVKSAKESFDKSQSVSPVTFNREVSAAFIKLYETQGNENAKAAVLNIHANVVALDQAIKAKAKDNVYRAYELAMLSIPQQKEAAVKTTAKPAAQVKPVIAPAAQQEVKPGFLARNWKRLALGTTVFAGAGLGVYNYFFKK